MRPLFVVADHVINEIMNYLGDYRKTCWFDESLFLKAAASDSICFALILAESFQELKVQLCTLFLGLPFKMQS